MTFLFFLLAIVFAWLSYNLYYPEYKHPARSTVSFLAGWLTGELAIHHIIWQLVLVFLFIWGGVVSGLMGAVAFLICVGSWLAMANFYLSGKGAKEEVEKALQLGLGADYQTDIDASMKSEFPTDLNIDKIIYPRNLISPAIERIKNISYGSFGQKLDIYRSRSAPSHSTVDSNSPNADLQQRELGNPVLLHIHGGAWTEKLGSKEEQALPLMNHMALRNWVCVSIDYRLCPQATFPEHIIDCKQALVWVKKHIAEYGGNPDFIVVTGGSAGGHLSSLLALSPNDPIFQPGFEEEDTAVQGAVPFYGVYDFTNASGLSENDGLQDMIESKLLKLSLEDHLETFQQASPLYRVNAQAPPFFVIQGDRDTLVPAATSREFVAKLRETSNSTVAYAQISGAQHAFDCFPSIRSEHVMHGVGRYLAWLYSAYLRPKD